MRRIGALFITLIPLYGQGPAITGSGYSYTGITVAPGQIATLFVTGLTIMGGPSKASGFPLPTQLDGVSVTIDQTGLALGHVSYAVPLLEVQPGAVTVQIPFEVFLTDHCPAGGYVGDALHARSLYLGALQHGCVEPHHRYRRTGFLRRRRDLRRALTAAVTA